MEGSMRWKASVGHRRIFCVALALFVALLLAHEGAAEVFFPSKCESICSKEDEYEDHLPEHPDPNDDNRAHQWSVVLLNQIRDNQNDLSPPGVSRALGVFSACLHDAVAAHSEDMEPAYAFKAVTRDPDANPSLMIDGAAYHAIGAMFHGKPSMQKVYQFMYEASGKRVSAFELSDDLVFQSLGFIEDPEFRSFTYGKQACGEVLTAFTKDGFDAVGNPAKEFKLTYEPVNKAQEKPGITNCAEEMKSLDHWQPLCVPDKFLSKQCTVQELLGGLAPEMNTFAISDTADYMPEGPQPLFEDGQESEWRKQAAEVLKYSAELNDTSKLTAEHWADGPDSTFPPGHWFRIAMGAAKKQNLDLKETLKVLFLVGTALNDAGVVSWAAKVSFDSVRPLQMIQCGSAGEVVEAWKGPYLGVGKVEASSWQPYQATTFVTPPFPGYVSGHSTFSAAGAAVLRDYFGGDSYLAPKCRRIAEGSSLFEGKIVKGQDGYVKNLTDKPNTGSKTTGYVPAQDVVLCWETFEEGAEDAGISRLHGGIHIIADHIEGKKMGHKVASSVYEKASALWNNGQ
ncbi:unnamed protein product [Ostreobium quekettii]|uniref:Vanadium-dependent haloperoxidase NapH1-like second helical-bundle domain-containing protein n=1 Tax=Ostreobium quekettii TaxID=121088 RepID=A0A8S1IS55_9CHLO|nr:unnamed protein product [Ostreobium quekettii]|eukprot:evm.model.scf_129.8 EVM.evm.TU.scf_129.8   scf_129:85589-90907(+)